MKQTKRSASKFLKNQDLFGFPVRLNFGKQGPEVKTVLGGFFSIIVKIIMTIYFSLLLIKMVTKDDTQLSTVTTTQNLKSLGRIEMGRSGFQLATRIFGEYGQPYEYTDDLRSYFSVRFFIIYTDLTKQDFIKQEYFEPAPCDPADFDDDLTKPIFDEWMNITAPNPGKSLLCINKEDLAAKGYPDFSKVYLENDSTMTESAYYGINIARCDEEEPILSQDLKAKGIKCKPREEIDALLKRSTIQIFSIEDKADMSIFGRKPIYKQSSLLVFNRLYQDGGLYQTFAKLRQNKIKTEDSYLQFGQNSIDDEFFDFGSVTTSIMPTYEFNKASILQLVLTLSTEQVTHKRRVYGFFDLIGDLGGVVEVLMFVFIGLTKQAEGVFYFKALSRLLRLDDFGEEEQSKESLSLRKQMTAAWGSKHEMKDAFIVSLRPFVFQTISRAFSCWKPRGPSTLQQKLRAKIFERGKQKIDDSLDIISLIETQKAITCFLDSSHPGWEEENRARTLKQVWKEAFVDPRGASLDEDEEGKPSILELSPKQSSSSNKPTSGPPSSKLTGQKRTEEGARIDRTSGKRQKRQKKPAEDPLVELQDISRLESSDRRLKIGEARIKIEEASIEVDELELQHADTLAQYYDLVKF